MIIDTHCHILPCVDDGAPTMTHALRMAELALESGVTHMVATPHHNFYLHDNRTLVLETFERLKDRLEYEQLPLELSLAMEYFANDDLPDILKNGGLTYGTGKYFLVEFGRNNRAEYMNHLLEGCAKAGFIPVIAHAERYKAVQNHPELCRSWCKKGWGVQVNKDSLDMLNFGFGEEVCDCAEFLFTQGWINCIASDAHETLGRNPDWSMTLDSMRDLAPQKLIDLCVYENPKRILQGKPLLEVKL